MKPDSQDQTSHGVVQELPGAQRPEKEKEEQSAEKRGEDTVHPEAAEVYVPARDRQKEGAEKGNSPPPQLPDEQVQDRDGQDTHQGGQGANAEKTRSEDPEE